MLSNLPMLLHRPELAKQESEWNEAGPEIVAGMVSLVRNYPAANTTYTPDEVREFVWMASLPQLVYHGHEQFVDRILKKGKAVEINSFPSLKSMTYTVFHKFYSDPNRKPSDSDAFDVLIAAALPYVEAVITEAHQAEVLRKTKRRDDFLNDLQVFTLRDFRASAPTTRDVPARGLREKV